MFNLTIISILIYNFFKETNFKNETLLSIDEIEFDVNEYENSFIIKMELIREKSTLMHAGKF